MAQQVRKAVLPAAGWGTRFLPATKAQPKEMLPIVDRPAIQYIVEECVRAGLDDLLIVTGWGKGAMEDHFDRRLDLEDALKAKGDKQAELEEVLRLARLGQIHFVRQPEPLGLGHAVLQGRRHVGDAPFVVVLGDDIVDPGEPFLEQMIAAFEQTGRPVVALMEVPEEAVPLYGIADATPTGEDGVYDITGLVEKPDRAAAPSNLAVIGRYVLPPEIFPILEETPPGAGGEIQLTDALQALAAEEPLVGVRLDGVRHDVGDKLGFLKATVWMAAERDDLAAPFLDWLEDFMAERRS